jgi:hypothetical protein
MKWSVETWHPLVAAELPVDLDLMTELEEEGLLEFLALRNHQTPLAGLWELTQSNHGFHPLRSDRRSKHALSCDVNGQNWDLVDQLLDGGVETYSTAINSHFGRAPRQRPELFRWEGPSGRSIPAFNGFHYGTANRLGVGASDLAKFRDEWLPRLQDHLTKVGYHHEALMVTAVHPFGDNGSIMPELAPWVKRWNQAHSDLCEVRLATLDEWWQVAKPWAEAGPVLRGDWTDFWVFGVLSRAREVEVFRKNKVKLQGAMSLLPLSQNPGELKPVLGNALGSHLEYSEHTFSVDWSQDRHLSDHLVQGLHKSKLVAESFSGSSYLLREGLAALATRMPRSDELLLFNPTPYELKVFGLVPAGVSFTRGGAPAEPTAQRHYQDRNSEVDLVFREERVTDTWGQSPQFYLKPTSLPPYGYKKVEKASHQIDVFEGKEVHLTFSEVENDFHRLTFDEQGLRSWILKESGHEVIQENSVMFNRTVEMCPDPSITQNDLFQMDWGAAVMEIPQGWAIPRPLAIQPPATLVSQRLVKNSLGQFIELVHEAPDCGKTRTVIHLPSFADWVEVTCSWVEGIDPRPRCTYLSLPFRGEKPQRWIDGGGCLIRPTQDQLPGSCHDFHTSQGFFALQENNHTILVANAFNPLVIFGHLGFLEAKTEVPDSAEAHVMITNNAWQCNFDPIQPGPVTAKIRIQCRKGDFDEQEARRFAAEASLAKPMIQRCDEAAERDLAEPIPNSGQLIVCESEGGKAVVVAFDAPEQGCLVWVHNFSDEDCEASLKQGVIPWDQSESLTQDIPIVSRLIGETKLRLPARRTAKVLLTKAD